MKNRQSNTSTSRATSTVYGFALFSTLVGLVSTVGFALINAINVAA